MDKAYTFKDLTDITAKLRSENGCTWDRAQTHESLIPCLMEESGEVRDAIVNKDDENLCEELGDLLFQVMIHSQIAAERGAFTVDDVVQGICEKIFALFPFFYFPPSPCFRRSEGQFPRRSTGAVAGNKKTGKERKTLTKQIEMYINVK